MSKTPATVSNLALSDSLSRLSESLETERFMVSAAHLGYTQHSARSALQRSQFPLPVRKIGGSLSCLKVDRIRYIAALFGRELPLELAVAHSSLPQPVQTITQPVRRGRGRPRKLPVHADKAATKQKAGV
jgi:hypothetical protein